MAANASSYTMETPLSEQASPLHSPLQIMKTAPVRAQPDLVPSPSLPSPEVKIQAPVP
eukprot:gene25644-11356_t